MGMGSYLSLVVESLWSTSNFFAYFICIHSKNQWVVLTICLLPESQHYTHSYYQEPMGS